MKFKYEPVRSGQVTLLHEELLRRRAANRNYLMSLTDENLLLPFYLEAGLYGVDHMPQGVHGGWETPYCQLRGHFLGHWLSAAAMNYEATGDRELKAKADTIVSELARCQRENGGEWVGSIPEKYLHWIAKGKRVWAPQYCLHKTIMGLLDMYERAGNSQALEVVKNFAKWFIRWSEQYTREEFDNILDFETGGMLEVWMILWSITENPAHKALADRYYRARLFDGLLAGKDVLTNMHANTTIPEVLGAAKAYELTGEEKWLDIVKAYWRQAVLERGTYCTGGQTCGEIWTPKFSMSARLGDKNQEHCTVYNMMRLADFLFRVTGEVQYADYYEKNLYNGVMAQAYWQGNFTHGQHSDCPDHGLLTYFLPLRAGARKGWATETEDFFCCHGTVVQANAALTDGFYYVGEDSVTVAQFFDSDARVDVAGASVLISQRVDPLTGSNHLSSWSTGSQRIMEKAAAFPHNPNCICDYILVKADLPTDFSLRVRIPWWVQGEVTLSINGEEQKVEAKPGSFLDLRNTWENDEVLLLFQKGLTACPLPGEENLYAFLNGPVVLAGLTDEERTLVGDPEHPETMLTPDNEREWGSWKTTYRLKNQERGMRFWPLYEVGYDRYTVYFPVKKA